MNQALCSDLRPLDVTPAGAPQEEHAPAGAVTYTIKVLSSEAREDGQEVRTVLFSRTVHGETIEISAETDAPNLLARLPELLDAALDVQRSLPRSPAYLTRLADETRLLRRLSQGGPSAERTPVLRLIGMAYRDRRPGSAGAPGAA